MHLRFFNLQPQESIQMEGEGFLFEAGSVSKLPAGDKVAKHAGGQWVLGNSRYLRLETRDRAQCHFESDDGTVDKRGPFAHLTAIDGVLIGDEQPLAMLQEIVGWRATDSNKTWPRMRLLPPPA